MKLIKKSAVLIALCLAILPITACTSQKNDLTQINIACFPNITHAQALLLKGQGALKTAFGDNITVNWITFNAGPSEIEALFAGEVDIGYIGPVPAISGYIQSSGDLHIIAGASNGGSVLIARKDVDIRSPGDLADKKVAIPQFGNTQHLSLLKLLSANGLSPTTSGGDVGVVQSSNADIANLMDQKNIDAALVPEPWGSILELDRNGTVVLDYDEVDPNGIPSTAVVIVRKDFLDANPEAVEKFMKAHKEATAYVNDNLPESIEIINTQIAEITQKPIEDDVIKSAFERLEISYDIPVSSIMDFAIICHDENMLSRLPDDNLVYDKYVK